MEEKEPLPIHPEELREMNKEQQLKLQRELDSLQMTSEMFPRPEDHIVRAMAMMKTLNDKSHPLAKFAWPIDSSQFLACVKQIFPLYGSAKYTIGLVGLMHMLARPSLEVNLETLIDCTKSVYETVKDSIVGMHILKITDAVDCVIQLYAEMMAVNKKMKLACKLQQRTLESRFTLSVLQCMSTQITKRSWENFFNYGVEYVKSTIDPNTTKNWTKGQFNSTVLRLIDQSIVKKIWHDAIVENGGKNFEKLEDFLARTNCIVDTAPASSIPQNFTF
jgi:hypothetical protein